MAPTTARTFKTSPPTRAKRRVIIYDFEDPSDFITAQNNPVSFGAGVSATIGSPQPLGWTGPIIQFGSTGAFVPKDLVLVYNERQDIEDRKYGGGGLSAIALTGYDEALRWLTSRVHPRALGVAPALVVVSVPNTATYVAAIAGVDIEVTRWDASMNVRTAALTVKTVELVQGFQSSKDVLANGLSRGRKSGGYSWGRQQGVGLGTEEF